MKLENVLYLGGGVVAGVLIARAMSKNTSGLDTSNKVIEVGSKGQEVKELQESINALAGEVIIEEDGLYSKKMIPAVIESFSGSTVLKFPKRGGIDAAFVKDLRQVIENTK